MEFTVCKSEHNKKPFKEQYYEKFKVSGYECKEIHNSNVSDDSMIFTIPRGD